MKRLIPSDKTFDVRPNKAQDQTQTEISRDQTHKPNQASCHFPDVPKISDDLRHVAPVGICGLEGGMERKVWEKKVKSI